MLAVKPSGRASSMPEGFLWGAISSWISTLILSGILAWLIERNLLNHDYLGYGAMIILSCSAYITAMISHGKIKRQKLLVSMISGIIYFILLILMTALFFGGRFHGVMETALMIVCGSLLYALLDFSRIGKRRKHRYI